MISVKDKSLTKYKESIMERTILITGVGKRIGYALAKYYLAQGHHVIGTYRTHYDSIEQLGKLGASLHSCDLTDPDAIDKLVAHINQHHERLDTIIHNASDWLPDNNGLSPSDIYKIVKVQKNKADLEIPNSLGRKTLGELESLKKIDFEKSVAILKEKNVTNFNRNSKIREIANELEVQPLDIYNMLKN